MKNPIKFICLIRCCCPTNGIADDLEVVWSGSATIMMIRVTINIYVECDDHILTETTSIKILVAMSKSPGHARSVASLPSTISHSNDVLYDLKSTYSIDKIFVKSQAKYSGSQYFSQNRTRKDQNVTKFKNSSMILGGTIFCKENHTRVM